MLHRKVNILYLGIKTKTNNYRMMYYTNDPMESDPKNIRLKVAFILIWLFLMTLFAFGQDTIKPVRYRVRAVSKEFMYYVPDTAYSNHPFRIAVANMKELVFRIKTDSTSFCVMTSPFQECRINALPGRYNWELLYRIDSTGWKRADGVLFVK